MTELVRFDLTEGSTVLVEVDEDSPGIERVCRGTDGVVEAGQRLTEALGSVRDVAQASMEALQKLSPGHIELEFGVKLAGEVGDHREDRSRGSLHHEAELDARCRDWRGVAGWVKSAGRRICRAHWMPRWCASAAIPARSSAVAS